MSTFFIILIIIGLVLAFIVFPLFLDYNCKNPYILPNALIIIFILMMIAFIITFLCELYIIA